MTLLSIGDIAPRFTLPTETGRVFDLYADDVAGRFVAVVMCPAGVNNALAQLEGFAERYAMLRDSGIVTVGVARESQSDLLTLREKLSLPFELLSDAAGVLFSGYGITAPGDESGTTPVTLLIRPNQHVVAVVREGLHAEAILAIVGEQQRLVLEPMSCVQPPVLMVPDVLTADDCRHLIHVYENSDAPFIEPGELRDADGTTEIKTRVPDYGRHDRVDHFITSNDLKSLIADRLRARLVPEIKKAFNYPVSGFEALRVACYEGERGGEAHGHRDNSRPDVAHRRFAVSINLNTEEFEGGELQLPEYGPRRYRPATGAAFVFSCSLLHEALAVTKGRRYVLLVFLTGKY